MTMKLQEPEPERPRLASVNEASETLPGLAVGVTRDWRAQVHAYTTSIEGVPVETQSAQIAPGSDLEIQRHTQQFNHQTAILLARGEPAYCAILRDADQPELDLPTPILGPNPQDDRGYIDRYRRFADEVAHGGLPLVAYDPEAAFELFTDRMAEHLLVRSNPGTGGGLFGNTDTVVTTRRHGDPVLQCLGYFVSTAITVGTSKVVTLANLSGRYSFGISAQGVHKFDGNVWNCPRQDVTVALP